MKEILFRGKRIDNGEWIFGQFAGGSMICKGNLDDGFIDIDLETLGQYTGFKDANGTMIFEGDVLAAIPRKVRGPVLCLIVTDICKNENLRLYTNNYTIIGNIHDNPGFKALIEDLGFASGMSFEVVDKLKEIGNVNTEDEKEGTDNA